MIMQNAQHIHFIGIGGIGISALARMMVHQGKVVTGTNDNQSPKTLDELRAQGVKISIGTTVDLLPTDVDVFVYSTAWDTYAPELMKYIKTLEVPVLTYFEALGQVSSSYKTIAIAGTHGKTTTTAMTALVLEKNNLSPTVIVGSILAENGSNFVSGESDVFLVEACEYRRSFTSLCPTIFAITNIEEDHLDYYRDLTDIQSAFKEVIAQMPEDGIVICDVNDKNIQPVVAGSTQTVIDYTQEYIESKTLKVPGEHNKQNAKVAIAVAGVLGVSAGEACAALTSFRGTWRRFEYKGRLESGAKVYDDYAHHPTEVRATLATAKELLIGGGRVIAVFQPHLFSRTKQLMDEFANAFSDADEVILASIYAAREKSDGGVTSELLAKKIEAKNKNKKITVLQNLQDISKLLANTTQNDIVLLMGAGDIVTVSGMLGLQSLPRD